MFTLDRANMWKRISAWLLDTILVAILATGFAFLISWITKYDSYSNGYEERYSYYENEYGIEFSDSEVMNYIQLTKGEVSECDALDDLDEDALNKCRSSVNAYTALASDDIVLYNWRMMYNLILIMVSCGVLLAIMICEFVIPLFLKNGQTVGKLCFGLCLVRSDCVKISNVALFTRALLGKFAVESIIPIYAIIYVLYYQGGRIWLIILALLLALQFALFFFTRNHTPIHDLLSMTVVVDKNSQKIYQSTEELVKAKEENAKEEAQKAYY